MAARLVRIKAQMLLPKREGDEQWEDPRAELVRRLLEYQQMREVVDILEARSNDRRNRFARAYLPQNLLAPRRLDPSPFPSASCSGRLIVCFVRRNPPTSTRRPRALDVEGAIATVRAVLAMRAHARWRDVISSDAEPWQVLSVLLALLELAKAGELRIAQPRPFGSVEITSDGTSEAA
jgi:segregation and condensation protein A